MADRTIHELTCSVNLRVLRKKIILRLILDERRCQHHRLAAQVRGPVILGLRRCRPLRQD